MDDDRSPLPFAGRRLSPRFERRAVVIAPGCARAYHEAEWRDAIVIVESGQIELELVGRGRPCFERGDVLWLDGLPLRALHNRGSEPAVLVAVARAQHTSGSVTARTRDRRTRPH